MEDHNNWNQTGDTGWQSGQDSGYGNGYQDGGYRGSYDNGPNGYWQNSPTRRLAKSPTNRMVCGVCAGIAEYFGWDPTLVRLVWVAASVILGAGFLGVAAYFIAAVIMPDI